jgi:predicted small metal-binding protein
MYEFNCGSPVCKTHLTAPTKDELMGLVGQHVVGKHRVSAPTKSMVAFLEANTIREVPTSARAV